MIETGAFFLGAATGLAALSIINYSYSRRMCRESKQVLHDTQKLCDEVYAQTKKEYRLASECNKLATQTLDEVQRYWEHQRLN